MQRLKEDVRDRILEAAELVFAESGYGGAKMGAIAKAAQISTGNVYRYFDNRDALFYAVFTDEFVQQFDTLVEKRVASLVALSEVDRLNEAARADADELLEFWITNRRRVVVLLDRADGSAFEGFKDQFIDRLVKLTTTKFKRQALRVTKLTRFTLRNIFETSVRAIVSILETYEKPSQIREAFEAFWSYQLAGLAGFERYTRDER